MENPGQVKFRHLCQELRFPLDSVTEVTRSGRHSVADYIARVRLTGLRVTATTTPKIHKILEAVTRRLLLDELPEVYVVNDPRANAFAPLFGLRRRPVVVINSGLVNLMEPKELAFVLGHELGHLGMGHGPIGMGPDSNVQSEFDALQMRSRQRSAEISADRIGLIAIRSLYLAAFVMVKLASGLSGKDIGLDIRSFILQMKRDPEEVSREWELSMSHPALPLRLRALHGFAETSEYARAIGAPEGRRALVEIDEDIEKLLAQLGDGKLSVLEDDALHKAIMWLGLALVMEDDKITPQEEARLVELVGREHAEKAVEFAKHHGISSVLTKMRQSITNLNSGGAIARERYLETYNAFVHVIGMRPDATRVWREISAMLR